MESILAEANRIAEQLQAGGNEIGMLLTGLFSEVEALQDRIAKPDGEMSIVAVAQIGDQLSRIYWRASRLEHDLGRLNKLRRELSLTVWIHQS